MNYLIKFVSEEVDGFVREIEIDSESTFLDLNAAVLLSCNYDDGQMTSFYLCDDEWNRGTLIALEDVGLSRSDEDVYTMQDVVLEDFLEEGSKLEFVFDPFSERSFFLFVKEEIVGEGLREPELVRSKGDAPQQIVLDLEDVEITTPKKGAAAAAEEDYLNVDTSQYENDEIDFSGFEIN